MHEVFDESSVDFLMMMLEMVQQVLMGVRQHCVGGAALMVTAKSLKRTVSVLALNMNSEK